jgi:hypothetical protein
VKQIPSRLFFMVYHVSMGLIFMNILAAVFLENFDDIEMKSKCAFISPVCACIYASN